MNVVKYHAFMRLNTATDLGHLLKDGRRRLEWSQTRLAEEVGVSRQWVSLVENGKTSVEFDLALGCLQALGYVILIDSADSNGRSPDATGRGQPVRGQPGQTSVEGLPPRTPLTMHGKPITTVRSRRRKSERRGPSDG